MLLTHSGVEMREQTRQSHPRRTRNTSRNKWVSHTVYFSPPRPAPPDRQTQALSSHTQPVRRVLPRQHRPLASPRHRQAAAEAGWTSERGGSRVPLSPSQGEAAAGRPRRLRGRGAPRSPAQRSRSRAAGSVRERAARRRCAYPGCSGGSALPRRRGPRCRRRHQGALATLGAGARRAGGCPSPTDCPAEPPSVLRVHRLVLLLREPPLTGERSPWRAAAAAGRVPPGPSCSQAVGSGWGDGEHLQPVARPRVCVFKQDSTGWAQECGGHRSLTCLPYSQQRPLAQPHNSCWAKQ